MNWSDGLGRKMCFRKKQHGGFLNKSTFFANSLIEIAQRFQYADSNVLTTLEDFASEIEVTDIAFADGNDSGKVWKRVSVLNLFIEVFDPILIKLSRFCTDSFEALTNNQIELPTSENPLTKPFSGKLKTIDDCISIAKRIDAAVGMLEDQYAFDSHKILELRRTGESLRLMSAVLRAIHQTQLRTRTRWCKACFRRAYQELDYCNLHYATKKCTFQDTANKKAKRTAKSLGEDLFAQWERHRAKRCLAGDNIKLFSDNIPINESDPTDMYLKVPYEAFRLVNETKFLPWSEISTSWNNVIDIHREVRKRFPNSAGDYLDWNIFVAELFISLQNSAEDTRHPLWVLYVIGEADEWFKLENSMADRRVTNTKQNVIEMHRNGISVDEIAMTLEIGKKYVNLIIKTK